MTPGARSKFGAPMFEPAVGSFWSKCTVSKESTCGIVGTLLRPLSHSMPGELFPLCPSSLRPWNRLASFIANSTPYVCLNDFFSCPKCCVRRWPRGSSKSCSNGRHIVDIRPDCGLLIVFEWRQSERVKSWYHVELLSYWTTQHHVVL